MPKTKVISAKTVFASKFFKVNRVEIQRDGNTFVKDIIDQTSISVILPYTQKGEIYLGSEYRDALGKTVLMVVGGKIFKDEDPLITAKKELLEEAGMKAAFWRHVATWDTAANIRKKMYVYFASDLEFGKQHLEEDEKIDIVKMPLSKAFEKIDNGEIPVGLDVAIILLFDRMQREGKL